MVPGIFLLPKSVKMNSEKTKRIGVKMRLNPQSVVRILFQNYTY